MTALFSMIELDDTDRDPACRASGCSGSRSTTGARSTTGSGRFDVDGRNALLTGDIGSGQVDAGRRDHHPAAARAPDLLQQGGRRRHPRARPALVRAGHYRSERNEITGSVPAGRAARRPVVLGDPRRVRQRRLRPTVTLAQVFWSRGRPARPARAVLRRRRRRPDDRRATSPASAPTSPSCGAGLHAAGDQAVHDHSREYGRDFRRRLGIESEQAMELFHQTVSMKAVDNLNDFVRHHMLEPFDAEPADRGAGPRTSTT